MAFRLPFGFRKRLGNHFNVNNGKFQVNVSAYDPTGLCPFINLLKTARTWKKLDGYAVSPGDMDGNGYPQESAGINMKALFFIYPPDYTGTYTFVIEGGGTVDL